MTANSWIKFSLLQKKNHPSYSPTELWQHILFSESPLEIYSLKTSLSLLWFFEHYSPYSSFLDFVFLWDGSLATLLALKDHLLPKDIQDRHLLIFNSHHHFDDILFYKKLLNISDTKWKNILIRTINIDSLSPTTLCILEHQHTSLLNHKPFKINWTRYSLSTTSPQHLSRLKPYVSPKDRVLIDLGIAVIIHDLHSVDHILNHYLLPDDFIDNCLVYALLSDHKKLCSLLMTHRQPDRQEPPHTKLQKQCLMWDSFHLSQDDILKHLSQVKPLIPRFSEGSENLIIHLLESEWFSHHTPLHVLSSLHDIFFQPRLCPEHFSHLSHYLLYHDIGLFLDRMLSNKIHSSPTLPPYFFRPLAPLHMNDDSLSKQTRLLMQKTPPQVTLPSIYA